MTEIRLEILKNEGQGFTKAETVKNISEKLSCSRQDVYYHYSIRDKWQSDFLDFQNAKELHNLIVARINHIYREASFQYLHGDNTSAKIGCLRLMMDSAIQLKEVCTTTATADKNPQTYILKWLDQNTATQDGKLQIEILDKAAEIQELLKQREVFNVAESEALTDDEQKIYHAMELRVLSKSVDVAQRQSNGESIIH